MPALQLWKPEVLLERSHPSSTKTAKEQRRRRKKSWGLDRRWTLLLEDFSARRQQLAWKGSFQSLLSKLEEDREKEGEGRRVGWSSDRGERTFGFEERVVVPSSLSSREVNWPTDIKPKPEQYHPRRNGENLKGRGGREKEAMVTKSRRAHPSSPFLSASDRHPSLASNFQSTSSSAWRPSMTHLLHPDLLEGSQPSRSSLD